MLEPVNISLGDINRLWVIDGQWFHNSMMTRDPSQTPAARFAQENRERAKPHNLRQFRYIKFLKPKFRRDLALPVLPYPKPHAVGVEETTPANQSGSVGAMPTRRSESELEAA